MKSLRCLGVGSLLSPKQRRRGRDRVMLTAWELCACSLQASEHLQGPWKKTHNVNFDLGNKAGMWFLLVPLFRAEPSLSSGEGKELDRRAHSQSTGGRSRGP